MASKRGAAVTPDQIGEILRHVGATAEEASRLAEVMHLNGWHALRLTRASNAADAATWLADFRREELAQEAIREEIRERRRAAGYRVK